MTWDKPLLATKQVRELADKYGCDLLTASILVRRGWYGGDELRYFLENDHRHLRHPFDLNGIEDAVERIIAAKEEGEKALVFGDRDVDGITSTVLMVEALQDLGMDVVWRVPQADEPYGLSIKAIDDFAADSGSLIVTVDCGISNATEIAYAAERGIDTIIVDHHNPPEELPAAVAIIDPKIETSPYPFRDLAGCGVAYKLAAALRWAVRSQVFGQTICLMDARPLNDSFLVEALKIRNLSVTERLSETIVPGMVDISRTRILPFLMGQQIFVWDAPLQKKTLAKIFGPNLDFQFLGLEPEIGKLIPAVAGKSLLRVKELSRIAKYANKAPGELDVFFNLFSSFIYKQEKYRDDKDDEALQLAALGTLADLMPLRDENRLLVRLGLAAMSTKPRQGIADLLYKTGLAGRHFNASDLSWQLCPVINATGRMGKADIAVRLLLEGDAKKRDSLADRVIGLNEERKSLGASVWSIVEPLARENLERHHGKLAVAYGEGIHRGVTGIMAGRLVNQHKVPALVVAFTEPDKAVGSLRSTRGYDVRGLLEQCADLFEDWGGHNFAAGFSLKRDKWPDFLKRLEDAASTIDLENDETGTLKIDAELPASYLNPRLLSIVDQFEPFGEENEPLLFLAKGLKIDDITLMGKGEVKHVKLCVNCGKHKWPAVYWQAAPKVKREFDINDTVDLVFHVKRNYFNGTETAQLVISDLKRS